MRYFLAILVMVCGFVGGIPHVNAQTATSTHTINSVWLVSTTTCDYGRPRITTNGSSSNPTASNQNFEWSTSTCIEQYKLATSSIYTYIYDISSSSVQTLINFATLPLGLIILIMSITMWFTITRKK